MMNELGKVISGDAYSVNQNDQSINLNIEKLNAGIYFVIIKEKGTQYSTKFVKL